MKVRRDFVTNSSSSSFIISKDDVSRDKLIEILIEIANLESRYSWDEEGNYKNYNDISYRYIIHEGTPEKPYADSEWGYNITYYDNHYIVDNDDYGRYNWDAIEDILGKYGIPWRYGYCD